MERYNNMVEAEAISILTMKMEPINRALSLIGPDFSILTVSQWILVLRHQELIFSRITPELKLLIIKKFHQRRAAIGMTGDGINDTPSLKQADDGISLIKASDIAKETSDLILT